MKVEIERLRKLSLKNQITFAYLICERLYPHYLYFSNNFSFGNPIAIKDAIIHIRGYITGKISKPDVANRDYHDVNINTPDTDDYSTIYVSFALNVCCAILNSLQFIIDNKPEHIAYVSSYGTDTVDAYIISESESGFVSMELEKYVLNHPLMSEEIKTQNDIISYLVTKKTINDTDLDFLLKLQGKRGAGSLF